jgi:hypothetical protein
MATTKAKKEARAFYFGQKKPQVGKLAGIEMPGFILVDEETRTEIGLKVEDQGFPKTVAGTKYELSNGLVTRTNKVTRGDKEIVVESIQKVRRGSKAVKLHLTTKEDYKVKRQTKEITGKRHKTVQVGVPAWATDKQIHDFFIKATKVKSFSAGGKTKPITRAAAPAGGS